jgi:CheY-like chemotaxis protein
MDQKKVLVVEDDAALSEIYEVWLRNEGYDVTVAHDGEEALTKLGQLRPALVLCDVMMPKISGFDVLDIIRSTPETKDTKVVMMTALSGGEHRDRGEKLGADLYMVKSQAGIEDIVNAVNEILGVPTQQPTSLRQAVPTPAVSQPGGAVSAAGPAPIPAQPAMPVAAPAPVVAVPVNLNPVSVAAPAEAPVQPVVVAAPPTTPTAEQVIKTDQIVATPAPTGPKPVF